MAPVANQGGNISELNTVVELTEWLVGRVGDDDDIVVDDLQADHNERLELEDERAGIKGTKVGSPGSPGHPHLGVECQRGRHRPVEGEG